MTDIARIDSISVSSMDNNVYLLTCQHTGARLLIDAADDPAAILELAGPGALVGVVTTHRHWDHIRALPAVIGALGIPAWAGVADADAIELATGVAQRRLSHGERLIVGDLDVEVIELRGHTPGSIALAVPGTPVQLITGDSLFPGGVGNTEQDPIRFTQLITDVTQRIFERFPDDTIVHPGHGAATTLGAERPHLAEWAERGW